MLETMTREPTTVGEVLQEEYLTPLGIGQEELAKVLGVTRATVNRLCNGHRRMSVAEANLFADLFETTADFWLNLQAAHDRWEARQSDAQRVRLRPIKEILGRNITHA
ncbi:HigA family addiction module antitoxin [Serratia marcescens]|uniref:HigA family addiction module antitoxin n=1 Tax=Serratia marcescens TaxID=615 RepID=UPI00074532F3|nr:HigA family addiction module antitoxin [Serratia marcescens]CUZ71213.1 Uncharacterized HTH-type transcriptional regulator ybaQ [Serratia marcescens]HAT3742273.1 HigA family addiction module antidote protein [Serratia marcescens]HAT3782505.1 HigA family addiction module antidote protein [Serratia marcescens]HAT3788470.1 HigA family addiction module antidote protein [Serratia marcescens]HAT3799350.1 HigA family addiction module antidote protein [Serratia marcescens]